MRDENDAALGRWSHEQFRVLRRGSCYRLEALLSPGPSPSCSPDLSFSTAPRLDMSNPEVELSQRRCYRAAAHATARLPA